MHPFEKPRESRLKNPEFFKALHQDFYAVLEEFLTSKWGTTYNGPTTEKLLHDFKSGTPIPADRPLMDKALGFMDEKRLTREETDNLLHTWFTDSDKFRKIHF